MNKIEIINLELDLLLKGIEEDLYNIVPLIHDDNVPSSKDGARFIVSEIKRQILEL